MARLGLGTISPISLTGAAGMACRAMFDVWAPENSVLREKVLEHVFLSDLAKVLLLGMRTPFEVLRSEFDGHGYDVVIEARGVVRHVQLKATRIGGKRATVDVNLSLARKPGGCVVWFMVDETTLEIGPYLWFGGRPGEPLPAHGARVARHSRGNAAGVKGERRGVVEVPRRLFTRMESMAEIVRAMFEAGSDHLTLLQEHLRRRGEALEHVAVDPGLTWDRSVDVAHMVDGYELAEAAGLGDPRELANQKRARAEAGGGWPTDLLELWVLLFLEHRRDRMSGGIGLGFEIQPSPALDELCLGFACALAAAVPRGR